jgi:hypothetical protein
MKRIIVALSLLAFVSSASMAVTIQQDGEKKESCCKKDKKECSKKDKKECSKGEKKSCCKKGDKKSCDKKETADSTKTK